jgi:hypothetical protein
MEQLTRRRTMALLATLPAFAAADRASATAPSPKITVAKDPNCGCCGGWVDHLKAEGFAVEVIESASLDQVKAKLGVPSDLAACHTAEVAGYVIEGHVPAVAIRRLLSEKPRAKGLAVPGMPVGSPGMEVAGAQADVYDVVLFGAFGKRVFARFEGGRELQG